ncbi:MAG: hypothetical protein WBO07_04250, partial [Formosimonas sp.]
PPRPERSERPRHTERAAPHRARTENDFEMDRLRSKIRLSNDAFFDKPYTPSTNTTTADSSEASLLDKKLEKKTVPALFVRKK